MKNDFDIVPVLVCKLPTAGETAGLDLAAIDALEDSALKDALRRVNRERAQDTGGVTVHSSSHQSSPTPHSSAMW